MKHIILILLQITIITTITAFEAHESNNDIVTIQVEQYFTESADSSDFGGYSQFQNGWMYIGFPGFKLFKKNVFTALEIDIINRDIYLDNETVNKGRLQRYGFFGGVTLLNKNGHRGSLLFGTGIATDFNYVGKKALYFNWIYDHRIEISDKFSFGLGILLSYNLGEFKDPPVNLLPSLRFKPNEKTFLTVAWDNAELKRFITERIALVAEVRYDFSFYRLGTFNYEFETVAVGGGTNIWLAGNFYLRLRYKEILYKDETLISASKEYLEPWTGPGSGRSIRLMLVYAK